ncbi:hypothetical protein TCAL_01678 [Tigriopus californicus]|uniref:ERAP1-like C-terminal domain-containing protein n=2 Tax=Tigriopus californicus TaxID=6832 RepID=A0A553PL53_TIGCA|nr:hypothetical protein TCAL_01678 [Tigriopus californicus]
MMKRNPGRDELMAYMSSKVNHIYQRLGIDSLESDTFFDTLLRDLSVGYLCSFGNPDCTNPAKAKFAEWMSSSDPDEENSNPIDAAVRSTVYCSAVAEGQSDVWDFLFERYLRGTNGNEKSNILSALGCSSNEETLQRYLALSMDPDSGIRKQDGKSVVSSVANNAQGSAIAFRWLDSNWDAIRSYFDTAVSSPLADMVGVVARSFNTQEELDGLKIFVQSHQNNLGTAQRATELAIETTEANIAWMEDYYNVIVEWLQGKTQS